MPTEKDITLHPVDDGVIITDTNLYPRTKWENIINQPTIPTVYDTTVTLQKNGSSVGSFTLNSSTGQTINFQLSKTDVDLGNVDNKSEATIKSDFSGRIENGNNGFITGSQIWNDVLTSPDFIDDIELDGSEDAPNPALRFYWYDEDEENLTQDPAMIYSGPGSVGTDLVFETSGHYVFWGNSHQLSLNCTGLSGDITLTPPSQSGQLALTSDMPSVGNGTLTLQINGQTFTTFTANQSTSVTADITAVTGVKGDAEQSYRSGNVNLTPANLGISMSNTSGSESITVGSQTLNVMTRDTIQLITGKKLVDVDCAFEDGCNLFFTYAASATSDFDNCSEIGSTSGNGFKVASMGELLLSAASNHNIQLSTSGTGKAFYGSTSVANNEIATIGNINSALTGYLKMHSGSPYAYELVVGYADGHGDMMASNWYIESDTLSHKSNNSLADVRINGLNSRLVADAGTYDSSVYDGWIRFVGKGFQFQPDSEKDFIGNYNGKLGIFYFGTYDSTKDRHLLTAHREYTFPDKSGDVALTSDLIDLSYTVIS